MTTLEQLKLYCENGRTLADMVYEEITQWEERIDEHPNPKWMRRKVTGQKAALTRLLNTNPYELAARAYPLANLDDEDNLHKQTRFTKFLGAWH